MKKKILIINRKQFGYHIDTYFYCKYLRDSFDILYICFDQGNPKVDIDGVVVKYVPRTGAKFFRYLRFLRLALSECRKTYDIYFIKYFLSASFLKILLPNNRYILDIRTGFINYKPIKRNFLNKLLKLEAKMFQHITIISSNLASDFGFKPDQIHVLPLGSDVLSSIDKTFNSLNLLYVGTLQGRNIDQTIIGFNIFYQEYKERIDIEYKIIGSGYKDEEDQLRKLVSELQLDAVVSILGKIPHNRLQPYFDYQNIGISYIPMTHYFDSQPPTKTFEYILSGMPTLATATSENKRIINSDNGVLINDNPESFYTGLKQIYESRANFLSPNIRSSCESYTWENIVNKNLIPYLNKFL